MSALCCYFQVHQPYRLRPGYNFFAIGRDHHYFDDGLNEMIMRRVASKCYLPTNEMLLRLIREHDFSLAFSLSGVFLEQCQRWAPEVLDSFAALYATGKVELLGETYHHSLAHIFSGEEFVHQLDMHSTKLEELFGASPQVFRNTELIYSDILAAEIERRGYRAILSEGVDRILQWRSPNFVYQPQSCDELSLLLKNYRLSDDIAFRFAHEGGLDVESYLGALKAEMRAGEVVNLFMDYETFGEHQWQSTGIFDFFSKLVATLAAEGIASRTPSEVVAQHSPVAKLTVSEPISWADKDRDLTPWLGNELQQSAVRFAYELEGVVKQSGDAAIIDDWRKLLSSDHFYYMSTKGADDGDVHRYFSPFSTPHDAYVVYTNALNDLSLRVEAEGIRLPDLRFGWSQ